MKSHTIYQFAFIASLSLCIGVLFAHPTMAFNYLDRGYESDQGSGPASDNFGFLGGTPSKWEPGLNTASFHSYVVPDGPRSPGAASWSAVPSGVSFSDELGGSEEEIGGGLHPDGATSIDIETMVTAAVDGLEYDIFNAAFNVWAAVANITNLGQVADGASLVPSGEVGDLETANGHIGDIRVSGFNFDGPGGDLAHGFQPGTQAIFGPGGSIAGDIHFDSSETWINDPFDTETGNDFDFFTVALHEIGHALGLAHSLVEGSVMEATYEGARRTLHSDDIAGIKALYGEIPEPTGLTCFLIGVTILSTRRKPSPIVLQPIHGKKKH